MTNIHTEKKQKIPLFSFLVAVRPLTLTKLCMRIEDVRPIFALFNFFGSDSQFLR